MGILKVDGPLFVHSRWKLTVQHLLHLEYHGVEPHVGVEDLPHG